MTKLLRSTDLPLLRFEIRFVTCRGVSTIKVNSPTAAGAMAALDNVYHGVKFIRITHID